MSSFPIRPDAKLPALRASNALRPVNWRWERAKILNAENFQTSLAEDITVSAVRRFMRDRLAGSRYIDLATKSPDMTDAVEIHERHDLQKWSIEGYILAGATDMEIALALYGPKNPRVKAIQYYREVFFDVADRLDNPLFISTNVLNRPGEAKHAESMEHTVKALGFYGRRHGVGKDIIDGFNDVTAMNDETRVWYEHLIINQQTRKSLVALLSMNAVNNPNIGAFIGAFNDMRRTNAQLRPADGSNALIDMLIQSVQTTRVQLKKAQPVVAEARFYEKAVAQSELDEITARMAAPNVRRIQGSDATVD